MTPASADTGLTNVAPSHVRRLVNDLVADLLEQSRFDVLDPVWKLPVGPGQALQSANQVDEASVIPGVDNMHCVAESQSEDVQSE